MKAHTDRLVWYCQNSEWVDWDIDCPPCGDLCGPVRYEDLPKWAKDELKRDKENRKRR